MGWLRRHASVVIIAVILLSIQGASLWSSVHTRAVQEQQGRVIEQKLCTTLSKLAALTPPAGDPTQNPSRAYLQNQHQTLAELGPDVGCPP